MPHRNWNPAAGHDSAPEQHPDGSVDRQLWAPSEGPYRTETGGAGGEPEGHSLPIRRVSWD
jgi:hypothetical protein